VQEYVPSFPDGFHGGNQPGPSWHAFRGPVIAKWAKNVVVKIPLVGSTEATHVLASEGIKVNYTFAFRLTRHCWQVCRRSLCSPFVGRLDDIGETV